MSGFGIRALKKVNEKEDHNKNKGQFFKHIVFGENSAALFTFLKLHRKYPGEVKWICAHPFYKDEMLKEWKTSLASIRSEEVAKTLVSLNPRLEIIPNKGETLFYKDTKFQPFGGRAKPHTLLDGEEFFVGNSFQLKLEGMFEGEELFKLDEMIKEHQIHKIISEIEKTRPNDLVENAHFRLGTGEFENMRCEHLYFCESPKVFFNLVINKNELHDDVQAFCASVESFPAIAVWFEANCKVMDEAGTLFIPQSMTHEWGSFIIDFESFDPEKNKQEFTSVMFLDGEEHQEEELAKKIKHMGRVIERVFPDLSKAQIEQSIRYSNRFRFEGINDSFYDKLDGLNVHFLGQSAPIKHENSSQFSYMARAIYAIMSKGL